MKRITLAFLTLIVCAVWANPLHHNPFAGDRYIGGSERVVIADSLVGTTWKVLTAHNSWEKMTSDSTARALIKGGSGNVRVRAAGIARKDSHYYVGTARVAVNDTDAVKFTKRVHSGNGFTAVIDSIFSTIERVWIDSGGTHASYAVVFGGGASPRSAVIDSVPAGRYKAGAMSVHAGGDGSKNDIIEFDRLTVGSHDPSSADICQFELRLYPDALDTLRWSIPVARKVVNSAKGPNELSMELNFSIRGRQALEVWTKAAGSGSFCYADLEYRRTLITK